jgi:hypothetical protein
MNALTNFLLKQLCFVDKKAYEEQIEKEKHEDLLRIDGIKDIIKKTEILYCIIPYFNYCKSETRKKLFLEFIERYKHINNLKLIIVEATHIDEEFGLPPNIDGIFQHDAYYVKHMLWIKENLIVNTMNKLPSDWKYVAWIDADITFLNLNWVDDTINELNKNNIIQLFQSVINLGPKGETFKLDQGFVNKYKNDGYEYNKLHKYGFWHPGYAWAMNRNIYNKFIAKNSKPLIDFGILGSGDHHMSLCYIGLAHISYPENISEEYKMKVNKYQTICKDIGVSLGYINCTIIHHWHGSLKNRKYVERWKILTSNKYDPECDIKYTNGIIELTEYGFRFIDQIVEYFYQRKEDSMILEK